MTRYLKLHTFDEEDMLFLIKILRFTKHNMEKWQESSEWGTLGHPGGHP